MKRLLLSLVALCLFALPCEAASRFLICTTACTITAIDTSIWSATSGGATGASVPGASDAVTLDANTCVGGTTCTATLNFGGTWTLQSFTMGACTASTAGCIFDNSVNNNNITVTANSPAVAMSLTGTGTRTMKLGSATYDLSGNNAIFNATTTTNLTFQAGTSTVTFTGNNFRSFAAFGISFSTITVAGANNLNVNTNATIDTFNVAAGQYLIFTTGTGFTITNPITWVGTPTAPIGITSDQPNNSWLPTFAVGSTMTWTAVRNTAVVIAGRTTCTNCFDLGQNANITFIPPGGASTSACILGGWLLWRDMPEHLNDNFPAWLDKAA